MRHAPRMLPFGCQKEESCPESWRGPNMQGAVASEDGMFRIDCGRLTRWLGVITRSLEVAPAGRFAPSLSRWIPGISRRVWI